MEHMRKKISVLIPVYNVEKYIRQCLDSVVNQTLQDIEIICVDDGSTDTSREILDAYAAKYSQIKVIHKENSGYGHTMNTALRAASGEYVGIVESDDFADASMFEILYGQANAFKADIAKSNYWHHEHGKDSFVEVLNSFEYNTVFCPRRDNKAIFHGLQTIWSAIYRKGFLMDNNIWFNETPGASYQDVSFVFKVLACAERVVFVKDAFLHYRVDNPVSSVKSKQKVYCIFDETDNIEHFLDGRQDIKELCLHLLAPLKFRLYRENFYRVALAHKISFLGRAIAELHRTAVAGNIQREYWEGSAWDQLQAILQPGSRFVCALYWNIQKRQMFQDGFWGRVAAARKIYLYGAGAVAKQLGEIFQQNGHKIEACIVSDMKGNADYLLGVPIIEYNFAKINDDDVILLALKEDSQHEILQKLQLDGHVNVIPLDREMRSNLEEM